MPVELRQIKYFLRIVETGSLSKAAESLYLTQPTLSRFLQNLEADLGTPLFTRSKTAALELTEAGKLYLETARRISGLWQELEEKLEACRQQNRLVFGIYGDHLQEFAWECARAVKAQYPALDVDFVCDGSLQIQRLVAQGQLQLGLCAFEHQDPRLTYQPCSQVEMNLVVAKDHPLAVYAGKERLRLHRLGQDAQFALMRDNTVLREAVEQYFARIKYTPNVRRTYMRHGSLVGILTGEEPLMGFCPENNLSEKLAYLALDPPFYYRQGICTRKHAVLTPAETLLASLLQNQPAYRVLD